MDSLTTTSRGCLLRQAAPHGIPAIGLLFVLIPHALSSVNISVKKPGSAFIRSILPLSRFTIRRHLELELCLKKMQAICLTQSTLPIPKLIFGIFDQKWFQWVTDFIPHVRVGQIKAC